MADKTIYVVTIQEPGRVIEKKAFTSFGTADQWAVDRVCEYGQKAYHDIEDVTLWDPG